MSTETAPAADLIWRTATDLRDAMVGGELTAVEVMTAFLDRIDEVNDLVNVIVFRLPREECLAMAAEADAERASGAAPGLLHGLPVAIKDLVDVAGMPTSRGSRAFAGGEPKTEDAPHVAKLRAAGALIIGKTNSPEFGVGTVTWNDVFGATRNPFDPSRHAGGSSGGAAALAAGMLPLVDGSDSGGSLRYPASFCNVVGLRTTPGTVPAAQGATSWEPHSVVGPMARSSRDAALMLSALSGPDDAAPLSVATKPTSSSFDVPGARPIRLAWNADLGGLPIDAEVRQALAGALVRLESAGIEIVDVDFDGDGLDHAWQVIEMFGWFTLLGRDPLENPGLYRDDFIRNVTEAIGYSATDLQIALERRYRAYLATARMLDGFDAFICPATPVFAPPVEQPWVDEIDGVRFDRYFHWQRLACRLTVTAHPVLALPAAFSSTNLPIGIQVVGRYGADVELLALGERLEQVLGTTDVRAAL